MKHKKSISAFTLAEVLITLLILGVLASITIPGLINNINNVQHKVMMKKIYSDISNAGMLLKAEGQPEVGFSYGEIIDVLSTKLSYIKKCTEAQIPGNCLATNAQSAITSINGDLIVAYCVVFNNGASVCSMEADTIISTDNTYKSLALTVDVNSLKGPNKVCSDIYFLGISRSTFTVEPITTVHLDSGYDINTNCPYDWLTQ